MIGTNCDWRPTTLKDGTAGCKCARCKQKIRQADPALCFAVCRAAPANKRPSPSSPGFGDRIASMLAAVGITEPRWLAMKVVVIENPTCGCKKRVERLNRWGQWLASWR